MVRIISELGVKREFVDLFSYLQSTMRADSACCCGNNMIRTKLGRGWRGSKLSCINRGEGEAPADFLNT
jgi:hypothetical protein